MARLPQKSIDTTDLRHSDKRLNNPLVGIAQEGTVPVAPKYEFSPHRTPQLRFDHEGETITQPQDLPGFAKLSPEEQKALLAYVDKLQNAQPWLEWSGKRELPTFAVDPVVLQVHERVAAQAIIDVARKQDIQGSLFGAAELGESEELEFYTHDVNWKNRLILGDSLQVMASLAGREDLAGQVQMIYLDPPYGIKFASNFQPQIGQRDVKDKEADLTREPETVRAFRDTWHLGIHSYLTYLRDRLYLIKALLADSGSVFVQISDENLHRVRCLMDEVFGAENFVSVIAFRKTSNASGNRLATTCDFLIWFAKNKDKIKYNPLFMIRDFGEEGNTHFAFVEIDDGSYHSASAARGKLFQHSDMTSQRPSQGADITEFTFEGKIFTPGKRTFRTDFSGLSRLAMANRLLSVGNSLRFKNFLYDFNASPLNNFWEDTGISGFADAKTYVVQTFAKVIARCLLMTTDPGDLVLDPTCGSGTTAYVAEQWGRRWITCDTSRVALSIARQRLLTARFDQFRFKDPAQGVKGGFVYRRVPHITLKSIAQNGHLDSVFEKHQPLLDSALELVNQALAPVAPELRRALKEKLARKQKDEGKKSITDADRRRWELPIAKDEGGGMKDEKAGFQHWTVPFDTDPDWPQDLQEAVTAYRKAWRTKMDEVNALIAAHADSEELVDQPEIFKGVVRVSGPFTVEAVQPRPISLGEEMPLFDGEPEELETFENAGETPALRMREVTLANALETDNVEAYLSNMIRLLNTSGVTFPNNREMKFSRLEAASFGDVPIHAEGRWHEPNTPDENPDGAANVVVVFGPQYGSMSVDDVVRVKRKARKEGYDHLLFAGFSFDAAVTAEIEAPMRDAGFQVHMAQIRPDVNPAMGPLLKDSPRDQLFSVFGAPRVKKIAHGDEWIIEMQGVDIYDPVKNTVVPTGADKVAAWFLDADYDDKAFCITQAFFPDKSAWDKIANALKGTFEPEVWETLSGTRSLPFPAGAHGKAAIKVIDPRGNEVMKVVSL